MGTLLIMLTFVTVLVVTGMIVNMYLYGPGAKRFKRSQSIRLPGRRYTTGTGMSDAEYFARLETIEEEGPRYARRAVMMLCFVVLLFLIVVISLLSGPH